MTQAYLADTSAWHRSGANPEIRDRWSELLQSDSLLIVSPVRLELLYSARSTADYRALADDLSSLQELRLDDAVSTRAAAV